MREPFLVPVFSMLGLLAACGAEPPANPAERPAEPVVPSNASDATPTDAQTTPTGTAPADAAAAEPAAPDTTADPTPTIPGSTLHVVALREGAVDLFVHRQAPVLSLEGEPVPWVKGRFVPEPNGARGLPPSFEPMAHIGFTRAMGGDSQAPLPTWVTLETIYDRAGARYDVHRRDGDRWRPVERTKGPIVAHYHAYVEREGALLGLQVWSPTEESYYDESEDEESIAAAAALERALKRARPTWVRLVGAEVPMPKIPAKTALTGAVTTSDGTLYAITERRSEDSPHRLLRWRPGGVDAESVVVPGLDRTYEASLSTSGDWVLAHGGIEGEGEGQADEAYLAIGHADAWERIPMPLPLGDRDMPPNVLAASRAPNGELWIALGVRDLPMGGEPVPVWRKPVDGAWEAVPLPRVELGAFGPSKTWIFEGEHGRNTWVEHEREPIDHSSTRVVGLTWAAGAIWVALQLDGDSADHGPRSVVLTNDPTATAVTVLPPVWKTELERANAASGSAKPGERGCDSFTVVLGPASLATEHPERVDAVDAIEVEDVMQPVSTIYVAELGGAKVLATRSQVSSPAEAEAVRKAVAAVVGTEVELVCHNPMLETVVKSH
ncbi:hypothetical protein [Paraliomyxa miuraensis]|uniref:hypothetical protein n=1 Tax=Paraliomyxa miuraensis TaxID=376150 RepID=UPI00225C2836|nr:hypothetical protein [Paraliomyxa miuraensis]MCX4240793.1 hypothetical protein [Paraliomyxa miuraensis]